MQNYTNELGISDEVLECGKQIKLAVIMELFGLSKSFFHQWVRNPTGYLSEVNSTSWLPW